MITSDECKELVVRHVFMNWDRLKKLWDPELSDKDMRAALNVKNWRRIIKSKTLEGRAYKVFDCKPFDGYMRGVVMEGDKVTEITVTVEGE